LGDGASFGALRSALPLTFHADFFKAGDRELHQMIFQRAELSIFSKTFLGMLGF